MSASGQPLPKTVPPAEGITPVPAPAQPKRRRWVFGLLVVGIALALVAAYLLRSRAQQRQQAAAAIGIRTVKVAVGSLVRTVRVSGVSSARNFAALRIPVFRGPDSRANLTLIELASPGSTVQKGDVVAILDPQNLRDHIDDSKDQVAQTEQDIRRRKAEQQVDWGSLQQTLKVARADLDKATLEHRAGEVKTEVERELLGLNLEEAQATYRQREADLAFTRASQRAELRIQEIGRDQNQIHLDRHLSDIAKFEVKAPVSGLVVMQPVFRGGEMGQIQEGDQVSPGQPIMKIVDPSSMLVVASINQSHSGRLRIGQLATVGFDAFPELRLKGHVHSIGALAVRGHRENYYVRNVPVRVAIEGSDPRVIPDLSAWADIEFERYDNVLMVPREAVETQNGKSAVYVRGPRGFEKRPVTLGPANHTHVAVLEGLRAGEEVALTRPM